MTHFVITGITKCSKTAHAIHVAELLSKHLENFSFSSKKKTEDDWEVTIFFNSVFKLIHNLLRYGLNKPIWIILGITWVVL